MTRIPTKRSLAALYAIFTNNTTGRTTNEDIRDLVVSVFSDLGYGTGDHVTAAELKYIVDAAFTELVKDLSPQLGGELDSNGHAIGFQQQESIGNGNTTINWKLGNKYKFTFGAQDETFVFISPSYACNLLLMLIQDNVGSRLITWPSSIKWANGVTPTISIFPNTVDIVSFYFDGTNYYGAINRDFK